jgi:hypothetical protein
LKWTVAAAMTPIAVAAALVPARDHVGNADIALVLVFVVVGLAAAGGRAAGAISAVTSALSFDFFHTRPYGHFRIESGSDVVTTLLLLAVGLLVGTLAAKAAQSRRLASTREDDLRRIFHVASLGARGRTEHDIIDAAELELTELLSLRDCTFEAPPFERPYERLERGGIVGWEDPRLDVNGFQLPRDGVELLVMGRGRLFGRFVLDPEPSRGVALERRIVAIALADQVGAVLAARESAGS